MPKRYSIQVPDREARRRVLELLLTGMPLDKSLDMEALLQKTNGLSGSDLKELCRNAAMNPVREYVRSEMGIKGDIRQLSADVRIESIECLLLCLDISFHFVTVYHDSAITIERFLPRQQRWRRGTHFRLNFLVKLYSNKEVELRQ
jgi:SpoVK/Ycf46/Vps4 family AAA+-type ATPase